MSIFCLFILRHLGDLMIKKQRNVVTSCNMCELKHVVCTVTAKPNFAKKIMKNIRNAQNEMCIFIHNNGFMAVKIIEISFFRACTKSCHLKNTQRCDLVHYLSVETCRLHIAKRNFKKKIAKRIRNGKKSNMHYYCTTAAFWQSKSLKFQIFGF